MINSLDISVVGAAWLLLAVFLAAIIRGYSGFGSAAVIVTAGGLLVSPKLLVPLALLIEIAASVHMLPGTWHAVSRRLVVALGAGMVAGTPLGLWLLTEAPADAVRAVIASIVLLASVLIWRGSAWRANEPQGSLTTGLVSGVANGVGAVGGLPVVAYSLSTGVPAATVRATAVTYLMLSNAYACTLGAFYGLFSREVFLLLGLSLAPLIFGIYVGRRRFLRTTPDAFRRFTLILLMALATAALTRSLV